MAKHVRRDLLRDTGSVGRSRDLPLYRSSRDVAIAAVPGREKPVRGALSPHVLPHYFQQYGGQHHITVLPSLPFPHVDHHPVGIDVRDLQADDFSDPHATGVQREGDRSILWSLECLEEATYCAFRQYARELTFPLGTRDAHPRCGFFQDVSIEESERAEGLIHIAVGFTLGKKRQGPPADLLLGVGFWHGVLEKTANVRQVESACPASEAAEHDLLVHP